MLDSLLPLLYFFGTPKAPMHQEPVMHPPMQWEEPAPPMMWEEEPPALPQPEPDPVVERAKRRIWNERATRVRRKGHMQTPGNYGAARMERAVDSSDPKLPSLEYTQRTHRSMVRSMRRLERGDRNYPRGCPFPCAEQ